MVLFSHMDSNVSPQNQSQISPQGKQIPLSQSLSKNQIPQQNQIPKQTYPPQNQTSVNQPSDLKTTNLRQVKPPVKPLEKKEVGSSLFKEGEPRLIEKKEFSPPSEVQPWVKEVKPAEEITLPQPIKDEYGQILMESAAPPKPKIVLPLNQPKIHQALRQKLVESVRWLAEWCLRLIKMFPKRVKYGPSN